MLTHKSSLIILLLLIAPCHQAYAQRSVSKGPESTYFGNYKPREPKSLNELPEKIREKVENHLKARLGDEFYSKLQLSGGQIVNFDDLYRIEPDARNYKWTIFAYSLNFLLAEPKKGIKAYHARILLDSEGNILREIDLPQISKNPEKANIISLAEVRKIAAKQKFPLKRTNAEISYDAERDSLIWTLEYKLKGDKYVWVDRIIRIDAHSGEVISVGDAERFY
jgi:uncharacterized membrane protein YkoI